MRMGKIVTLRWVPFGMSAERHHSEYELPEIEHRLRAVGDELRLALADLLEPLTGPEPKPADIGEVLELDRTQAWRISRVLLARDPFEILHETPAPKGLSLIVEAAERAGAPSSAAKRMRHAIAGFAGLLHEFPDGRSGLAGALSDRVPRAEEASHKAAKKKIVQGMGQLLGLRAAVRYVASVVRPSAGHDTLADVVALAGYKELRRLRVGPAPVVFSGKTYTRVEGSAAPAVETLEGTTDPDPMLRLLSEFSELPPDALQLEESGRELRLKLGPDQPPLNEPITLFFAQCIARSLDRYRTGEPRHELVHHAPVLPSDVNVFDTLIHKDLFPTSDPPMATVERFGFNPQMQAGKPEDAAFRVEVPPPAKSLGNGLRRMTLRSVPRLGDMLAELFRRIGEDPNDYRVYRTTVSHLPPGFAVLFWLEMPEKGDAGV